MDQKVQEQPPMTNTEAVSNTQSARQNYAVTWGGVPSCCSAKDKEKPLCLIWHDIEKWKRSRCCKPHRSQLKLLCPIPEENHSFMDQRPWVWKNILLMRLTEFYLDTSKRSCLNSLRLAFAETWKNNVLCHCKYSKKANLKSPVLFGYWRKNMSSAPPSL